MLACLRGSRLEPFTLLLELTWHTAHTAAPATPLGRLRSWLCCHPGKNPVALSYVPEACQSPPSVSPPGARRQRKGMLGIYGVVRGSGRG